MSGLCLESKGHYGIISSSPTPRPREITSDRLDAQPVSLTQARPQRLPFDSWVEECKAAFSNEPRFSGLVLDIQCPPEKRADLPRIPFSAVFSQVGISEERVIEDVLVASRKLPEHTKKIVEFYEDGTGVISSKSGPHTHELAFRVREHYLSAGDEWHNMLPHKARYIEKMVCDLKNAMHDANFQPVFQNLEIRVAPK
jgi:hypothetical protein